VKRLEERLEKVETNANYVNGEYSALDTDLKALAETVAKLEAAASPKRVMAPPPTHAKALLPKQLAMVEAGEGITSAELADRTGTNRASWNNWAAKAVVGDVRVHKEAGSWRLIGKAPSSVGGPARWLWEQAVGKRQQTSNYATTTSATATTT
jgi:hypothetical protein